MMNTMNIKHVCPLCNHDCKTSQRLKSHMGRKTPCVKQTEKLEDSLKKLKLQPEIIMCQYCKKNIVRKDNMARHLINCKQKISLDSKTCIINTSQDYQVSNDSTKVSHSPPSKVNMMIT